MRSFIIEHNGEEFECREFYTPGLGGGVLIKEHPRGKIIGEMYDIILPYYAWEYDDEEEYKEDIKYFKENLQKFLEENGYYY
jgi:hypothetical protein